MVTIKNEVEELETGEEADSEIAYLANHALDALNDVSEICVRSCSGDKIR